MKTDESRCDLAHIELFLNGRLAATAQEELQEHLTHCQFCRDRIENACADATFRGKIGKYLGPLSEESRASSFDPSLSATVDGSVHDQILRILNPSDDPQMLGRVGGYEILGVVGSGGMGVVLKGVDTSLKRVVAIKVLAPFLAVSPTAHKRFSREAQAAAAVTHDNVIDIYNVSEFNGLPYLVMPYLRGPSLQKRLDDRGPLPVLEVLRIGYQIASGLAAAHKQGLVHRDIKPSNILLSDDVDRVTITDFGLARSVDDATITRSGTVAGTPHFMSPEQARGEPLDARSDLFSLGSVLYVLATGTLPFQAESSYGVLRQVTDVAPVPMQTINNSIPGWLSRIVEKLHQKLPQDRYPSAVEVADILQRCLAFAQQPAGTALPPGVEVHEAVLRSVPGSSLLRKRQLAMLVCVVVVVCGSFAYRQFWRTKPADRAMSAGATPRNHELSPRSDSPSDERLELGWDKLGEAGVDALIRQHMAAIMLAIQAYAEEHEYQLPPAIVANPDLPEDRRLSGFALLLPYFHRKPSHVDDQTWSLARLSDEQVQLMREVHASIDFSQGWDAPVNRTAARRLIPVLLTPGSAPLRDGDGNAVSHFAFIRGTLAEHNGAFPGEESISLFDSTGTRQQISDGTSETLALGQVTDSPGPWLAAGKSTCRSFTHPTERFQSDLSFGSGPDRPTYFAKCDGSLMLLDIAGSAPQGLSALVTRAGVDNLSVGSGLRAYRTLDEWKAAHPRSNSPNEN